MAGDRNTDTERGANLPPAEAHPAGRAGGGPPESAVDAPPWTVRRLLGWIAGHLAEREVDSPRVSAEILLTHVLDCDRLRLYMEPDRVPSDAERLRLRELVARSARHEPVQYLVGEWSFRGRMFEVGPCTLIPRPATETLVETAIAWWRGEERTALGAGREPPSLRMADIGTGTGVIAVSVVAELAALRRKGGCAPLAARADGSSLPTIQLRPEESEPSAQAQEVRPASLRCLATDIVPEAVALAARNVARHRLAASIDVRLGSLFEPFRGSRERSFDLLCANPPYVSDAEWQELLPNVREFEPASALRGGVDGLDLIRSIVAEAPRWLRPGGLLLIEIGHHQRDSVAALVADRRVWSRAEVLQDHEEYWRVLSAVRA